MESIVNLVNKFLKFYITFEFLGAEYFIGTFIMQLRKNNEEQTNKNFTSYQTSKHTVM